MRGMGLLGDWNDTQPVHQTQRRREDDADVEDELPDIDDILRKGITPAELIDLTYNLPSILASPASPSTHRLTPIDTVNPTPLGGGGQRFHSYRLGNGSPDLQDHVKAV